MTMNKEIAEIANGITQNFLDPNLPIIVFVADLMHTMGWKPEHWVEQRPNGAIDHWNFYFTKSPCLLVHIAQGNRHKTVNLDGYNYAYQVKLVTDAMTEVGFFD